MSVLLEVNDLRTQFKTDQGLVKAVDGISYHVDENEIVAVNLPDKVGQAKEMSEKIKLAGINLDYIYGSTSGSADSQALMVIGSKENQKVVEVINK